MHSAESFLGSWKGPADLKYCAPFFQSPWKVYRERIIRSQGSQEHENANSVHGPNINTVTNSGPRILGGTHSWLLQLFMQRFSCNKEKKCVTRQGLQHAGGGSREGRTKDASYLTMLRLFFTKQTLGENILLMSMATNRVNTAEDRWFRWKPSMARPSVFSWYSGE